MTQKTLSAIMILFIAVTLTGAEKNVEVEITLVDIRNGATLDQGDYIILRPTYSSREPISLERQESGRWRGVVPYGNYMVEASAPLHAPTRYLLSLWQNRYYLSLGLSQSLTSLHAGAKVSGAVEQSGECKNPERFVIRVVTAYGESLRAAPLPSFLGQRLDSKCQFEIAGLEPARYFILVFEESLYSIETDKSTSRRALSLRQVEQLEVGLGASTGPAQYRINIALQ